MKILIATGIYPPDIGGPAQYAKNLYETWKKQGHEVKVAAYRWERAFPPLVRHILYFLKIIRKGWNADLILVLDTWSASVPTMCACMLMGKKYLLRTGGDFLWETYVERTGDMVLLKDFYATCLDKLSFKEKLIFKWGGLSMRRASVLIFSTKWQKEIFEKVYKLDQSRIRYVKNYCKNKDQSYLNPENRTFVAGTRHLKWKNINLLKEAFEEARKEITKLGLPDIELDTGKAVYDSFVEKIRRSYAVILISLGDISPNMIFDAVGVGTPFILTKENGIGDCVGSSAILVDPKNKQDIVRQIVWLADPKNREKQASLVRILDCAHSWDDIAKEIVSLSNNK
jgi:glycosyltransferase involved in cell wall biosynthesis